MFHVNKPVETGLVPATKGLLAKCPEDVTFHILEDVIPAISPTEFLRNNTSTTEWETLDSIFERVKKIDPSVDKRSMHTILCQLMKQGKFEVRKQFMWRHEYRRISNMVYLSPKKHISRKVKRKVTNKTW